jgi:hypothetical protein
MSLNKGVAAYLIVAALIDGTVSHAEQVEIGCPPTHEGKSLSGVGLFEGPPSHKVE